MHAKKIVLLAAIVGLLAYLALEKAPKDDPAQALGVERLLADLDRAAVDFLRIENVESQRLLEFRRGPEGHWRLVHPLDVPADDDTIGRLLARIVTSPGTPTVEVARDEVGLAPPRAVVELFEGRGTDAEKRHVLEFGDLDLDETQVHVLADGRVLRTNRGVWDELQRPRQDFRRQRLIPDLEVRDVVGFSRSGLLVTGTTADRLPEVPLELYTSNPGGAMLFQDLAAELVDDEWLATEPVRTRLDPAAMPLFVSAVAQVRADRFFDGTAADPVGNGFDAPLVEFELTRRDGRVHRIELASPSPNLDTTPMRTWTWVARVDGDDSVHYGLDAVRARALTQPFENLMQFAVLRVLRRDMTRVAARSVDAELVLERRGERWFVLDGERARRADDGLVAEWIGDLDRLEFVNVLAPSVGDDLTPIGAIEVATALGEDRIELGPTIEVSGVEVHTVRRAGEDLWGFVERDLLALSGTDPRALLDLRLMGLEELEVGGVTARRIADDAQLRWTRDSKTQRWAPVGAAGLEDRVFARLVDRVVAPVAAEWLDAGELGDLDRGTALEVTIEHVLGETSTYRLYDTGTDTLVEWDGLWARLTTRTLYDGLVERLDAQ